MSFRKNMYRIIFEAETPAGKTFDVLLLWAIAISVAAVLLESVTEIRSEWGAWLRRIEWFFTILFTVEYGLRVFCVRKPWGYIRSFYGLVDLLAILPTYISLFIVGAQSMLVIRALRLLRIFRIFKLVRFVGESRILMQALYASRVKIAVFLGGVFTLVLIMGSLMYLIEGEKNGFTSIPRSIYWAIVTMTTVGYGDITPKTPWGQFLSAIVMVTGYAIIAIPTGIVSVELAHASKRANTKACPSCNREGHALDSVYCRFCGDKF